MDAVNVWVVEKGVDAQVGVQDDESEPVHTVLTITVDKFAAFRLPPFVKRSLSQLSGDKEEEPLDDTSLSNEPSCTVRLRIVDLVGYVLVRMLVC